MNTNQLTSARTLKQKVIIVLALAIPAMVENILQTVVGFTDTLFVAKLGINEVTAVGIANTIIALYIAVLIAISVATSSLIARKIGANDLTNARAIAKTSVYTSLLIGATFGLITLFFAAPLLSIMGATNEVQELAITYFKIVGIPAFLIALMFTFGSILRASGDTKTPMIVGIWMNVIHLVLDYIFIFGIFNFSGWGVAGAAIATVVARFAGVIMLYIKVQKSSLALDFNKNKSNTTSWNKPLLVLAFPTIMERLIMRFGQVVYFGLIVAIGTKVFAAHTIAGNIETFAYMPGMGLAVAATVIVGQLYGAEKWKEAKIYGWITVFVGIVLMSFIGILLFFSASLLSKLFTTDIETQNMIITALKISALSQPILAISLIITGALQGLGDTKSPMYSTAIGMWGIRVVGVYILAIYLELGILGIWLAIAIDLLLRSIFLSWRYAKYFNSKTN